MTTSKIPGAPGPFKRFLERLRGPKFLNLDTRQRCLAPFCGERLTEEELVLGSLYCAICTPAVERTGKPPRVGAPPVIRPIGMKAGR